MPNLFLSICYLRYMVTLACALTAHRVKSSGRVMSSTRDAYACDAFFFKRVVVVRLGYLRYLEE